ncbi:MAG TPA: ATP-binding protein [Candidatus Saccharimonadales bacterium]|nr:ATP-binding protein [Candidatus Saccharimonadales bacterium]
MQRFNNWYVVTGGPSTGKTTLLAELEKLGYKTVPEAARTHIDSALSRGISVAELRKDEKKFQEEVTKLKQAIERGLNPKEIVFLDRGMHDTLAYLHHYGFVVENWVEELMHEASYSAVFLLEPLAEYVEDYARTEDEKFTHALHRLLHEAYATFGMEPVYVPPMSVEDRVKFVLSHIKQEQPA